MWELHTARPFGRLSKRNAFLFAMASLSALFISLLATTPTAHAESAKWQGAAIIYEGDTYRSVGQANGNESYKLPKDTHIYGYLDSSSTPKKAHIIYFGADVDPAEATEASYVVYDFSPPDNFSNPTQVTTISLEGTQGPPPTSCDSTYTHGIGWIVCPVTNFLAAGMDWLFNILSGFLEIRPATTDQSSALYRAWGFMRNLANVLFIIGFLVIIYSQITSFGLSNYGVKRMLPRLFFAAILVNISYWIAAAAIDLSNIMGYALQEMFISMRNSIVGSGGNGWQITSWESIASFILSGGAAAAALGVFGFSVVTGTAGAAVILLVPMLLGVILSALVAILIMAGRQALITVLVILSPIACVAYLLPNTEKYFERWRNLFTDMLLVFPIFSVIFGGAQLAGTAIIQNADSINAILLGMAVQVAPLAITPLIIKISGNLLNRVAGIVNNPNRGIIDKARGFTDERAAQYRARQLGARNPDRSYRHNNLATRIARRHEFNRRRRAHFQKGYEGEIEVGYLGTPGAAAADRATRTAAQAKQIIENEHHEAWLGQTITIRQDLRFRVSEQDVKRAQERLSTAFTEAQAGVMSQDVYGAPTPDMVDLTNRAHDGARFIAVNSLRHRRAEDRHRSELTRELLENVLTIEGETLREYAGGIQGAEGAATVFAGQIAAFRKEYNDKINEKYELMRHFNLDSSEYQSLALGTQNVTRTDANGHTYTFDTTDEDTREAAINNQLKAGSYGDMVRIIEESGLNPNGGAGLTYNHRTTISQAIPSNGLTRKAIFWGSKTINDVAQGKIYGREGLNEAAAYFLVSGKISDEALSGMSAGAIEQLFKVANQEPGYTTTTQTASPLAAADFARNADEAKHAAKRIMENELLRRNADAAAQQMLERYRTP